MCRGALSASSVQVDILPRSLPLLFPVRLIVAFLSIDVVYSTEPPTPLPLSSSTKFSSNIVYVMSERILGIGITVFC